MKSSARLALVSGLTLASMSFSQVVAHAATIPQPQYPSYSKNVTITWWTWTANPNNVIKAFNQVYPNIHVVPQDIGSGSKEYTKLATVLKSGSGAPDVAQIEYQMLPKFISSGGLQDISKYVNFTQSYFPSWTWNQVSQNGKVYAVPEDIGQMALFYRTDVFKKYGITVPTTWQQFADDANKLHTANPNMYFSYLPINDPGEITGLLWQGGAKLFQQTGPNSWNITINSPQAKKVMNFWGSLIKKGDVQAVSDYTPAWETALAKGEYAATPGASWSPAYVISPYVKPGTNNWNASDIPQWQQNGTFVDGDWGGATNAVTTQSKHPQAAALFAAFINTASSTVSLSGTPYTAGGRGLYPADKYASQLPQLNSAQSDLAGQNPQSVYSKGAASVNTSFQWSPWTDYVYNQMTVEFANAASGKETWDQALDNIQKNTVAFAKTEGYQVVDGSAASSSASSATGQAASSSSHVGEIVAIVVIVLIVGGALVIWRRRRTS
ncbi:ABC transporter substrate-binding protein [Alicyclobacillus ferrooxydans]|uniref:ABC transporter substrate-binding protein n=1 Tax=Alicyclobacillus ferrooxydans TaxID=471514 RepID=UPI0006D5465A|nr:extracellular solute-binding protein [Alicyclobacillus ferrooxydans]